MAGTRAIFTSDLAFVVKAASAKTFISKLIVVREIKAVLDQWGTGVGVVANTIATDPWIQQRKSQDKKEEQCPFEAALLILGLRVQIKMIVQQRSPSSKTRYDFSVPDAPSIAILQDG